MPLSSLRRCMRVRGVIVGDSFIGLEAASALRQRFADVTVLTPHAAPFAKRSGAAFGASFKALHARHGVRCMNGKLAALEARRG